MPIPFLLIGIGAGAAALGLGKSIKAGIDQYDASSTNEYANSIIHSATEKAKKFRKNSSDAISSLGQTKIDILSNSIKPFVETFEKLHNVELSESVGLDELQNFKIDKQSFSELKEMEAVASSIIGGAAGGAALGAITAFGAYGGAMAFGAASTGTAIATLSGAAATNATLAFLGGGALAANGLGIVGGTAVLGGLVAGPALAVLGFVVGAKASANKDRAYSNLAEAKKYEEEIEAACVLCRGIRRRARMFERLLLRLDALFKPLICSMEETIATSGTDYSKYTLEQKQGVAAAMSIAGAIKAALDTPILTEDGNLTDESKQIASSLKKVVQQHAE